MKIIELILGASLSGSTGNLLQVLWIETWEGFFRFFSHFAGLSSKKYQFATLCSVVLRRLIHWTWGFVFPRKSLIKDWFYTEQDQDSTATQLELAIFYSFFSIRFSFLCLCLMASIGNYFDFKTQRLLSNIIAGRNYTFINKLPCWMSLWNVSLSNNNKKSILTNRKGDFSVLLIGNWGTKLLKVILIEYSRCSIQISSKIMDFSAEKFLNVQI